MTGGDPKLQDFLTWVATIGVDKKRLIEYRRIALELLERSGGGPRITESHILQLIDHYADVPGSREVTALIEEVGEAILRFQASRPIPTPPPIQLPTPASGPAAPVPSTTPNRGLPFVSRPEDRVAGDLLPPSVPRHTPPAQPVVSFTAGEPRKRPARSSSRRSGFQFRCPKCKIMVTADENMACPRCGVRAPHVSVTSASVPAVAVRPGRSWLLPAAGVGVLVLVLVALAPSLLSAWRDRSESVAGTFTSPHLGVRLQFPDGWRHAADADRAPTSSLAGLTPIIPDAISLRRSLFFHGKSHLHLVIAARPSQVTDDAFGAWADAVAAAPESISPGLRELSGLSDLRLTRCVAGAMAPRAILRCAGETGRSRALAYAWEARTVTVVAVFLSSDTAEDAQQEADDLIAGLDVT